MPPYSRIEERPSEMTNVAISISSDVSLSPLLLTSNAREIEEAREKRSRNRKRDTSIGVVENSWPSVEFRCLSSTGGGGSSISISIHERFIRVETTDAEHRRVSARRNITINLAELITGHAFN